jgi:citrate lyase subunit gamma (acyl carrier protein)
VDIKNKATAGTLQSNDCFITIGPGKDIEIELDSPVKYEFGDQILSVVKKTLEEKGIKAAKVKIEDRGALDCTIEARLITAIRRSE